MKKTTLFMLGLFALTQAHVAQAALTEFSAGHGDIGLAIEEGGLELHYHFEDNAVLNGQVQTGESELGPDEAYVRVGDGGLVTVTGDFDPLNLEAGNSYFLLSANGTDADAAGVPFLGIATEELGGDFSSATFELTSFSGPGEFAAWQVDSQGTLNVAMQTFDAMNEDFGEIVQSVSIGHDHYFMGFTEAGVYNLGITATAVRSDLSTETDFATFRFAVGSATAIPEPSSMAAVALGTGLLGLVGGGRRRKRGTAPKQS